ncbi:MAG: GDYXXLXY domain-containing protein [Candidatus Pseudobacter hemicellulosilyticus]|uniref:GDYXXLXY domain-containing protein n=1 Tax=Candidatus Pseudobacter hemicellulosilyticus TaxID=3121375 RepID=A0AAJ6BJB6_9BACT|nr:MAG: GDYXXLXY domain-containing protein [Pseudobacter sp.]
MKKYKWLFILLNLALLLLYFNHSVVKKEELIRDGQLVLLELEPVDPRSLMQGDYMQLRYKLSTGNSPDNLTKRGYCVVQLDSSGVADSVRFQPHMTPLNAGEHLIEYTAPDYWKINIGAESFFFQEGQAAQYDKAKYGGVKVDSQGNSLLVGLYDEQLRKIE